MAIGDIVLLGNIYVSGDSRESCRESDMKEEKMDKDLKKCLSEAIKNLAMQRAMLIKLKVMGEEEITDFINQEGEKWAEKYDKMNPIEILFEGMMEIAEKIRIIYMEGEPQYSGKEGVIEFIDAIGQVHGTWGGCAVIPEEDIVEVIE